MAIRLDEPAPEKKGIFTQPEEQEEAGDDALSLQAESASPVDSTQGLSIIHDSQDRNKGMGIRI